jgi:hypothetical protein
VVLQNGFFILFLTPEVSKRVDDDTEDEVQHNNDNNEEEQQVIYHAGNKQRLLKT